ncbi:energy-coupling factor transporter ATPase [Gracilibacillus kekensis]|uniref:Energy-coupling factor transport system ATP-binding protein n=1 Tax=Gracilibacillus kekensis TaxID=1027249 RepID=A0A1M7QXE0_9BACI|nr:energy-coupling factor transporter ATPase [Gracilibacillus kekensis]SHN36693.1 energy-coupling factor transport system ATP-binding protein [Gracilibacillus kekensis]
MSAIEFREVFFRYNEESPFVLKNFNLTIEQGQTVAVLGHNGSGKSTVSKLVNGLLTPQSGEILVNDTKIRTSNVWEIRKNVGMVFQNPENQFVGTTVRDDVAFGLENRGIPRDEMEQRIKQSLMNVGMEQYMDHEPHHLSGGQKQRIAIASVMAIKPEILLLDEATSMLDPKGRKEILATIQTLKKHGKMTMVMITHDLNEIVLADRIIVMNKGNIYLDTTKELLFTHHKKLESIGLTLPFTVELALELEKYDYQFALYPLNYKEFNKELWTSNLNK